MIILSNTNFLLNKWNDTFLLNLQKADGFMFMLSVNSFYILE